MRDKKISPKIPILIACALVVLAVLTAVVWIKPSPYNRSYSQQDKTTSQQSEQTSDSKVQTVSYDGQTGKNALELLKTEADVVTQGSAYGEYVDSINGVTGGTDGKYWAFYVNGQMAQVGAADYQTKDGDKIEWKFE